VVTSLYPLWDQPNLARDVEEGRYFLPDAPTGDRETLVTSPLNAEPQQLLPMPRPSGWHVWAAVFTAGFFLLLTVQAYAASVISGVLAIFCVMRWCWFLDDPVDRKTVDIGAGIRVPTYASGPASHGWWAMVITLIVAAMVLAMTMFSYVFLWSGAGGAWRPPPGLNSLTIVAAANLAAGLMVWFGAWRLSRGHRHGAPIATALTVIAAGLLATAWAVDFNAWRAEGLAPNLSSQGAIIHAFLAWQGFFVAVSVLMVAYVGLRWLFGYIAADRPVTVQLVALFLAYTAGQGMVSVLLTRLFPGG
jgi:cytochrome c oxidase subunit I+III